eukprot:5523231-Alexandrium_andersonii.AAC.1
MFVTYLPHLRPLDFKPSAQRGSQPPIARMPLHLHRGPRGAIAAPLRDERRPIADPSRRTQA